MILLSIGREAPARALRIGLDNALLNSHIFANVPALSTIEAKLHKVIHPQLDLGFR
jgi:hypothetical protein